MTKARTAAESNPEPPKEAGDVRRSAPLAQESVRVLISSNSVMELPGGASFVGAAGQTLDVTSEQADFIVANGLGTSV